MQSFIDVTEDKPNSRTLLLISVYNSFLSVIKGIDFGLENTRLHPDLRPNNLDEIKTIARGISTVDPGCCGRFLASPGRRIHQYETKSGRLYLSSGVDLHVAQQFRRGPVRRSTNGTDPRHSNFRLHFRSGLAVGRFRFVPFCTQNEMTLTTNLLLVYTMILPPIVPDTETHGSAHHVSSGTPESGGAEC
ncbi:hypothetical protein EVAR_56239_1 [Eumeta japonica]|uniref:Uncharacterized protein n=1 Tax=Eumeta variegata TaxID=151549 RepID=A0A4C1XFL2_EUMVA|nr:hypothetical protein EVAR_56239_1 [Eumeta japonica]